MANMFGPGFDSLQLHLIKWYVIDDQLHAIFYFLIAPRLAHTEY